MDIVSFEKKYNKSNSSFAESIHDDMHSWYEVLECDFDWIVSEVKRLDALVENRQLREDAQLLWYALVSLRGEMLEPHQYDIIDRALKGSSRNE